MRLMERLASIEKKSKNKGLSAKANMPDEVWMVGVERNDKGELVEVCKSLLFKISANQSKPDDQ